jgi:hypothetical protein
MIWHCGPDDFKGMGATARKGIGLPKPLPHESWSDVALRAIGMNKGPVIARFVAEHLEPDAESILDFGCGPAAIQTRALQGLGYNIVGFEWPPPAGDRSARGDDYAESVADGVILPDALRYTYDVVVASNVLNVQPTWGCFWTTLMTLAPAVGGVFYTNLASSPRRIWDNGRQGDKQLESMLGVAFEYVTRLEYSVAGSKDWVWACRDWRGLDEQDQLEMTHELLAMGEITKAGGLQRNPDNLPPGFEGFDASLFGLDPEETYKPAPTLAAWESLKRDDSFTLGGRQRWVVIRPLDGTSIWVIKEQQVGKRRRKDFVAHLTALDASGVEVREGAGGDLHLVGPVLDHGVVQDIE